MILIITTLHKKADAVRIGKGLLEKHLIACYNLWPVESAYWWKGELLEEPETVMILKSRPEKFDEVAAYIKKESGYEVPEVIALAPSQVEASYEKWVEDEVK